MGEIDVTVRKAELVERLIANREAHRGLFEKAFEGYRKAMLAELERRLDDIKNGKAIDPYLRHTAPVDYTAEYDTVIDMLGMDINDTVLLTQAQFRCYVRDDWGWKKTWTESTAAYL